MAACVSSGKHSSANAALLQRCVAPTGFPQFCPGGGGVAWPRRAFFLKSPRGIARLSRLALLRRYREIYFDFKRDFTETSTAILRKREQAELFRGAKASRDAGDGGEGHLYREHDALNSSLKSASGVIGQATEVRSALHGQRRLLEDSSGALGQLKNSFPSIGRVIGSIQQRRYRDNMCVGLVIAACICFTLWWLFG